MTKYSAHFDKRYRMKINPAIIEAGNVIEAFDTAFNMACEESPTDFDFLNIQISEIK